jgi:RNA polymerase sigma-70 factor (ECF subfamily)
MSAYPSPVLQQRLLLDAARRGDETAFRRLIEPHRPKLHAHCRRRLGSVHDADDALQETLLRAWRGMHGFDGRSALRPWLYQIATNVCRDALKRRSTAVLPIAIAPGDDDEPADRATVLSPAARYEQRETVELAVTAALQHLAPGQRAALVLSDVLGFSAREAADVLETTPTSIYSATQRARKVVDERLPERGDQAAPDDASLKQSVERYMRAIDQADVPAIVTMLSEDAGVAA